MVPDIKTLLYKPVKVPYNWDNLVEVVPQHFWEPITNNLIDEMLSPATDAQYMEVCREFGNFLSKRQELHFYINPDTLVRLNATLGHA
jgi:hypothetical protein